MKETIASGLSRESLRRIAACTMLVDHIGATLFPGVLWLRCVGRLAFPIFAFFLGEGFRWTHSRRQYLLRLVLFALLSELPFNRMVFGRWIAPSGQNVLWTLALGLCAIACAQRATQTPGPGSGFSPPQAAASWAKYCTPTTVPLVCCCVSCFTVPKAYPVGSGSAEEFSS